MMVVMHKVFILLAISIIVVYCVDTDFDAILGLAGGPGALPTATLNDPCLRMQNITGLLE
jgi:hypothetical protein